MASVGHAVLVVEDDGELRAVVAETLTEHGFVAFQAASGSEARAMVAACPPDVVLLDLGLPDEGGLDLLRFLTEVEGVPVVVLSGRNGEYDRVVGLDLGADDYVVKPFSARELVARLNAVLRRSQRSQPVAALSFGALSIDAVSREVRVDGHEVGLTAKEFDLLAFLAAAPRQVFTRAQLLQHVWGSSPHWQDDKTVAEHVHRVRRKLDERDRERWIQTVRGVGYRFAAPVMDGP